MIREAGPGEEERCVPAAPVVARNGAAEEESRAPRTAAPEMRELGDPKGSPGSRASFWNEKKAPRRGGNRRGTTPGDRLGGAAVERP